MCEDEEAFGGEGEKTFRHDVNTIERKQVIQAQLLVKIDVVGNEILGHGWI